MKIKKVTLSDDWCGIYLNGALYYEGHTIPDWVWLDICMECGAEASKLSYEDRLDGRWAEQQTSLPNTFEEIRLSTRTAHANENR